jgi:hypothetical protein
MTFTIPEFWCGFIIGFITFPIIALAISWFASYWRGEK